MHFPMPDPKNYLRLQRLPAEEAIACYLEGAFTIGEENALAEAIQNGLRLPMKKEDIESILSDCMADEVSVEECKQRLISET